MNRLTRATPWMFAAAAVVFVARLSITADLPEPWWRVVVISCGLGTALSGWRVVRMPIPFVAAILLASARLSTLSIAPTETPTTDLAWGTAVPDIGVGAALCIILAIAVHRRLGTMSRRDFADVLAILIGASIVTWLTVTNPLIAEQAVSPVLAIAASAYLPISALIVTFTVELMFAGLTRNRTIQFVVGAAVANLVAAVINSLLLADAVPAGGRVFAVGIYGVAFLLLCAGLSHVDGPESLRDSEYRREHRHESRVRLTVMAMGLVAPVASISLIAPMSRVDAAVRTTAMLGLVAALVVRLSIAQQDHNRARLALLERVNRDDLTGLPTRTRSRHLCGRGAGNHLAQ